MFEDIKSKPNLGSFSSPLLLLAVFVSEVVNYFIKHKVDEKLTTGSYVALAIWVSGSFFFIAMILKYRRLHVHDGVMDVYNIVGNLKKSIYLDDIVSWDEEEVRSKKNPDSISYVTTLHLAQEDFTLLSVYYRNYAELKAAVTATKPNLREIVAGEVLAEKQRTDQRQKKELKYDMPVAVCIIVAGLVFLFGGFYSYLQIIGGNTGYYPIQVNQVITAMSLSDDHNQLKMHLTRYPVIEFIVPINNAYSNERDFATNLKPGDSVTVTVDETDYDKKLEKMKPMGLFEQYTSNANKVTVHELNTSSSANYYYDRNESDRSGPKYLLMAGVVMVLIGFMRVVVIRNRRDDNVREVWMNTPH